MGVGMKRPRIIFPFVEAGYGHIMTEKSLADAFEKKYGDLCEVVRTYFYRDSDDENMRVFEKRMAEEVKKYSRNILYGYATSLVNNLCGSHLSNWFVLKRYQKGAYEASVKKMRELMPDAVVSTHWATNYIAMNMENRPLTAVYVPDAHINACFRYPCDLTMISAIEGYNGAKMRKCRYNNDNFKLVPFAIRQEAFEVSRDKSALRAELGFKDRFTLLIMDGAYGIGLMRELCELIVKDDLPVNIIAVCGKNKETYDALSAIKLEGQTDMRVFGFTEEILKYISASDLYFGKSGNGIAEPTFFGIPAIVTHCANYIEKRIAQHYINIGNTKKIFKADKCVEFIKDAIGGGEEYKRMKEAALSAPPFGAEKAADEIFALVNEKFRLK